MTSRMPAPARRRSPARNASGKGASRHLPSRPNRKFGRLLAKCFLVICACGSLAGLILWADPLAHLKQITNRPIAGVSIEGQFHYISQQEVQSLVAEHVTANFLQLDMATLKQAVERSPWIDNVAVSRQWPDRLVVRIREQQPIARWGKDAYVNMRGEIIEVEDNARLSKLPLLYGNDRYAKDVMQTYVRITKILSPVELGLSEVHLDDTLAWTLRLKGGMVIRIGREDVFEKLQRLLDVFPSELASKADAIATIDLRYDNGFAVAWKQTGLDQLAMAKGK